MSKVLDTIGEVIVTLVRKLDREKLIATMLRRGADKQQEKI